MASIRSTPHPATARNGPPSPKGSSAAPKASAGIRMKSATGDVPRLASSPYMAVRLKCCMANGPVANPATTLAATAAVNQPPSRWTARIGQGADISRGRFGQASTRATKAAVAANDIWKPGVTMASGCMAKTMKAATARPCIVTACRSSKMARKAMEAVIAARSAGGGAPDTTR